MFCEYLNELGIFTGKISAPFPAFVGNVRVCSVRQKKVYFPVIGYTNTSYLIPYHTKKEGLAPVDNHIRVCSVYEKNLHAIPVAALQCAFHCCKTIFCLEVNVNVRL